VIFKSTVIKCRWSITKFKWY